MSDILVTIEDEKYLDSFLSLLKELKYISSFKKSKNRKEQLKTLTDAEWIRPGRSATNEEIDNMINESEKGPFFSLEESKILTLKEFEEWKKTASK